MARRFAVATIVIGMLSVAGPPARAQPEDAAARPGGDAKAMAPAARDHFNRGSTHYNVGDYEQAVDEFKAAYRIEPRLMFLWSIAQAQRLKGDCPSAIRSYESFLRSGPSESGADRAREQIAACKAAPAPADQAAARPKEAARDHDGAPAIATTAPAAAATTDGPRAPAATVVATAPVQAQAQAQAQAVDRRWWQDGAGHVLFWTGVAAGAAGAALLVTGNHHMSDAATSDSYGSYRDARDAALTLQRAGAIALGAGGALVAAGLIRFIYLGATTRDREHAAPETTVGATLGPGAAGLTIGGSF